MLELDHTRHHYSCCDFLLTTSWLTQKQNTKDTWPIWPDAKALMYTLVANTTFTVKCHCYVRGGCLTLWSPGMGLVYRLVHWVWKGNEFRMWLLICGHWSPMLLTDTWWLFRHKRMCCLLHRLLWGNFTGRPLYCCIIGIQQCRETT